MADKLAVAIGAVPEGEAEGADMLEEVAGDLLAAIKSGDKSAVAEALRAAHEECAASYGDEE